MLFVTILLIKIKKQPIGPDKAFCATLQNQPVATESSEEKQNNVVALLLELRDFMKKQLQDFFEMKHCNKIITGYN